MERFPVVCLGASAGGPEVYQRLLAPLPAGARLSLVVVNPLRNADQSLLLRALRRLTALPVIEVEPGTKIEPGRVFVIPADPDLALSAGGRLSSCARWPSRTAGHRPSRRSWMP